jgi:sterol desaturase/sphingolipid hydroxylase (fatty acid hydroxylase superfamily)
MHADVADAEVCRIADVPGRKLMWLAALGALSTLAVAAWAVQSSILLPASVVDRYQALGASLDAWAVAHLPATVLPLVRMFARLVLSPLLYLGLATVLIAERLAPADRHQKPVSRGMIHDGFAWYLLDAPLKAFLYAIGLGVPYWAFDSYAPFLRLDARFMASVPTWALLVTAIVASDLLRWIHHYLSHKVTLLWYFHSIHHSQRELNLFTQSRFHAVDVATLIPILYVPLYALHLNYESVLWIHLLTDWYSRVSHANLRTNYGPFRHALVTPQSHRIHHSHERRHRDRNFGILFSVWDRLFGTQWPNHDEYPATGIADEEFPWENSVGGANVLSNYFAQVLYPFRKIFRSRG